MQRLLDPAERPEKEKGEVIVRQRAARVELDRSAEAFFRLVPLRVVRVGHPQRLVRFPQQRVQLDRLLRRGSTFRRLLGDIEMELTGSECACRRETRVSGGKRGIFGDGFLKRNDTLVVATQAPLKR